MTNPNQPGYPGDNPGYQSGQNPGGAGDPYAAGPPAYPNPPYPAGSGYTGAAGSIPEPVRPNTVTWAFWCWILTTVASLVGLIITLTSSVWDDAINAGIRQSGTTATINVNSLVTTLKVTSVVAFLIFAGVYLLFAFKMRAGRNWARIVLTIFGALTLLSSVTRTTNTVTVNGQSYQSTSGPGWVTAALALIGIILMYVGQSNKFFADTKARRQQLKNQQLGG